MTITPPIPYNDLVQLRSLSIGAIVGPVSIVTGLLLAALSVVTYFLREKESWTIFIPAGFGVVFIALGAMALKDHLRKHAMHAAAALGLIGFVAPLAMVIRKALGGEFDLPQKSQLAMAVICGAFTGLCVNSFIQARRARRQADNAP